MNFYINPYLIKFTIALTLGCLVIVAGNTFGQDALATKAKRLKQLYTIAVKSSNGDMAKQQFFDAFPNTFKELNELYGYEKDKPAPLYENADQHIHDLFNNLTNINDTLYYKKIITIAIGAHWEADAIGEFQDGLQKRILDKPQLTLYLLRDKTEKDIASFWAFYFDYENSFSRKRSYDQIIKQVPANNKKMIALITIGYQQSTNYWKDNH
jgi:hypothetical protein